LAARYNTHRIIASSHHRIIASSHHRIIASSHHRIIAGAVMDLPQHFGIGIYMGKNWENVGILWRGAYQLGASYIFTVGDRYRRQLTDTEKSWLHIPLFHYQTFEQMKESAPLSAPLVAIEEGGTPLPDFAHPPRSVYLLGAEDSGLPRQILQQCHYHISIPAVRKASYNVAIAGTLVMYDRMGKMSGE
jgi:tRNA G18 (ribose-2'-O)-methylase SpoU